MSVVLNEQQEKAVVEAMEWFKNKTKQVFEISGPAGSGKTTIVKQLVERLGLYEDQVVFCAFVGKAAMQLNRSGVKAKTIHSTIYDNVEVPVFDENGKLILKNNRPVTKPSFMKKDELDRNIKLIVVDEGSMIDSKIASDLKSFNIPILVLGDLNQLPPVFGNPAFLTNPDVVLTQIMRQNQDSNIIKFSQKAINGEPINYGIYGDDVMVIRRDQITDTIMQKSDIVICAKNSTRDKLNKFIREEVYGIYEKYPVRGEKLICRQNNWRRSICNDIFLINGLIGYVENVSYETFNGKSIEIDFRPEFLDFDYFKRLNLDYNYLFMNHEERSKVKRSFFTKMEFGYVITCHLSQGSQYETVLVIDENVGTYDYHRKWLYTAITRASKKLILAI